MTKQERDEIRREEREDAMRFILDSIDSGRNPMSILDELGTFYDGDPCDLF